MTGCGRLVWHSEQFSVVLSFLLCSKMSWQDYVDKQLLASRCVTKAAIAGHDGNVWAKSEGFEVSRTPTEYQENAGERVRTRERKKESERASERASELSLIGGAIIAAKAGRVGGGRGGSGEGDGG